MPLTLTIRLRLALAMGFLTLLLVLIGILGLSGMSQSNAANHDTYTNQLASTALIGNTALLITRERTALDRIALDPNADTYAADLDSYRAKKAAAAKAWADYVALPADGEEQRIAADTSAKQTALQEALDDFAANAKSSDPDQRKTVLSKIADLGTLYAEAIDQLQAEQEKQAGAGYAAAQSTYGVFRAITIVAVILGALAAFFTYLSLRGAIGRPLALALGHFDRIAAGDLSRAIDISRHDEMGAILGGIAKMRAGLIATVSEVRLASDAIGNAAHEIATGNMDLSSRTEQQAASLEETAASMEELTGTVKQNMENVRQASTLTSSTTAAADQGKSVVESVVATMASINESSTKIGDIISIIEGIAFQTNILALNAAVEAARAGEQGRGFAVVASEVRTLAQRSSAAAKEIKELIGTSAQRVQAGNALVDEAGQRMTQIHSSVRRVTDIMGEILTASAEQSTGIDQISLAVSQMDSVTQQNAALVEQAAAAAQSLEEQAHRLQSTVSVFRL